MERMVVTRIVYLLESKKILAPCQAGFRKNRSTEEQIARIVQDAFDGLEEKKPKRSVVTLLDFSRAYDRVWKNALYLKMQKSGIPTCLTRWTKAFLDDRRGRVLWNEKLSSERVFREGLPQGSVMAPTLWLIYCNDLPGEIEEASASVAVSQFADDTALMATSRSLDEAKEALQPALTATERWCRKWKVLMSAEKCNYTIITLDPAENNAKKKLKLLIGENEIPYCKNPVFLGIKLDPQLTFREHAKDVARKMATRRKALQAIANKNTGATQRNLRTAYIATTRAVADYASSTWMNMAQPSTRDFMESQQNKCARVVSGCLHPTSQQELLACAELEPLRIIAKKRAGCLREKMLRLDEGVPAHGTASRNTIPRLRSKTHEAWKKTGKRKSADDQREFRGSFRRIALEPESATKLDTMDREPLVVADSPPWEQRPHQASFHTDLTRRLKRNDEDTEKRKITEEFLASLPPCDTQVWTDGSVDKGHGGAGAVVIRESGREELKTSAGLFCSSFTAEMTAINMTLEHLQRNWTPQTVRILTDSLSAVERLEEGPEKQRCSLGRQIWSKLAVCPGTQIVWIPSHCGVQGNEEADRVANAATTLEPEKRPITLQTATTAIKLDARRETLKFYAGAARIFKARKLDRRRDQTIWNQLMSGHSLLDRATLRRFGATESDRCPDCDEPHTAEHVMKVCQRGASLRHRMMGNEEPKDHFINNPRNLIKLVKYAGIYPY
ncbi:uncharacterized protein LOC142350552 [Convolutriloba macropyga]|uniref:uncharacterized protein LOC142350552 n=1 Tax=Convolutriloba macropyga TaxID=536237 RepID=UPI003F520D62